jgi:acyl dehydratase
LMENAPWYFEDLILGEVYETRSREISQRDVENFGEVEGARTSTHRDPQAGKESLWGKMTVHGLLTLSISFGLAVDPRFYPTALALLSVSWTFHAPAVVGDELRVRWHISEKKLTRNPARGIVVRSLEVLNQEDVIVASGTVVNLWARRPDAGCDDS